MIEIDYEKLAEEIVQKLSPMIPPDKVIWDGKHCAEYLCIGERHFIDKLSKSYDFPTPIRLPSGTGKKGHARWLACEIQAWAMKHKRKS